MLQEPAGHGVARLVVGHRLLLLWLEDLRLLLQTWNKEAEVWTCSGEATGLGLTSDHPLDGLLKVLLVDGI